MKIVGVSRSLVARSAGGGEVISSNLITPTKSPNFQTLYFQPVFKAKQGIAYHLLNYSTIPLLSQYYVNTIFLLHKVGDKLAGIGSNNLIVIYLGCSLINPRPVFL